MKKMLLKVVLILLLSNNVGAQVDAPVSQAASPFNENITECNSTLCAPVATTQKASLPVTAQISNFFGSLFDTHNWPPRWQCGTWSSFHGWLYIGSDIMIWLAYFAIPLILAIFVYRRKNSIPFRTIFILFIGFILACGLTHLVDAAIFWWPVYRLSALIRFFTAGISVGTVFALVQVIPRALELKSPDMLEQLVQERTQELHETNEQLKREMEQRKHAEQKIIELNQKLEERVKQKTRDIQRMNDELKKSNELIRSLQKHARIGVWEVDVATKRVYWSEEVFDIHELPVTESVSLEDGISFYHPESVEIIKKVLREAIENGKNWDVELKLITNKRNEIWVRTIGVPTIEEGKTVRVKGLFQDIDKSKRIEEDLRTNQEINNLAIEAGEIGVWNRNFNENDIHCNYYMRKHFGLPEEGPARISSGTLVRRIHAEDMGKARQLRDSLLNGKAKFHVEYRVVLDDGSTNYIATQGVLLKSNDGKPGKMIGISINITERRKIEEELRTQQEVINLAIEAGEIGIWNWDIRSGRLQWNKYMHKHFGLPPERFMGKFDDFRKRLYPDDVAYVNASLNEYITHLKKSKYEIEHRVALDDGTINHVTTRGIVLRNEEGAAIKMIGTCQNITERNRLMETLRESEERFRSAIEYSAIGIALVSQEGRFLKINKAMQEIVGYTERELLQMDFQMITHPEDLGKDVTFVKDMLRGAIKTYKIEKRFFHKKGHVIWIQLNGSLVRSNMDQPLYFIIQIQDITSRKRVETEIINMNAMLETRTEKLEEANKELESFTYSVSHDLRAPLRSIHGYAKVLQEDYIGKLGEEGSRVLNVVMNNAQRMGQLIDDLLEFSRIGRRGIEKSMIDMLRVVEGVSDELKSLEKGRDIRLSIQPLMPVKADVQMIRQVWVNLISNAIKYTRKEAIAEIEIGCIRSGNEVRFYIKDNGVGFSMKYQNKLFEVFQRLHTAEEFEGTGVGLALVKRIITRHGGKIWAESEVNAGATFYFTLPAG